MSIRGIFSKGKGFLASKKASDLFIAAIIILVGFASFGLGRLSRIDEQKSPVQVQYPQDYEASVISSTANTDDIAPADSGLLVASRNGSKYHFPWCSGAQRIKEENKIWFSSTEEAMKAGYSPAANCKGLK